jgi:hypothetical protein
MATAVRKVHSFVVTLAAVSEITDAVEDAVLGAGCDDALLWSRDGNVHLRFRREAESLGDAIGSAVRDVERAGFAVARVEVEGERP